jgi:pimeloyl-ACP methyl ester carboxylesterase
MTYRVDRRILYKACKTPRNLPPAEIPHKPRPEAPCELPAKKKPTGEHAFGAAPPSVLLFGAFTITGVTIPVPGVSVPQIVEVPVVFVHGLGSSFEHGWRPAGWIDLVADTGRTVIPVDILGHGAAARPHDPEAYADLESSVARVLPDTPVDAIGFSLGAQLLLRIAAADPSRFRRLVVIGAGENVFHTDGATALAAAFENGVSSDDVGARVFTSLAAEAGNDPLAIAACLRRPVTPLTATELASVQCPVLVILGDKDFAGPAEPLVDALPDARLVMLRGIDHFQSTRDFTCIDAALEFIDAVPT